jgi:hypothetical protein
MGQQLAKVEKRAKRKRYLERVKARAKVAKAKGKPKK